MYFCNLCVSLPPWIFMQRILHSLPEMLNGSSYVLFGALVLPSSNQLVSKVDVIFSICMPRP